jgi:hypothetical protein
MFKESHPAGGIEMKRPRVIVEIRSYEQAKRVEETVKTGYAETTQEELLQWMAVEEDLAGSYRKLESEADGNAQRELAAKLREESEGNLKSLANILGTLKALDAQRARRIEEISRFID